MKKELWPTEIEITLNYVTGQMAVSYSGRIDEVDALRLLVNAARRELASAVRRRRSA